MKALVAGFNPFASHALNPAQRVVEILRKRSGDSDHLFEILETSYAKSEARLRELILEHRPGLVVFLGLAQTRAHVTLERFALNVNDCSLADNCGEVREGSEIVSGGPAGYRCGLRLEAMRESLKARGMDVAISNHAGAFVCNHVYYVVSDLLARELPESRCVFVHLPMPVDAEFGGTVSQQTVDNLVLIVSEIIEIATRI